MSKSSLQTAIVSVSISSNSVEKMDDNGPESPQYAPSMPRYIEENGVYWWEDPESSGQGVLHRIKTED